MNNNGKWILKLCILFVLFQAGCSSTAFLSRSGAKRVDVVAATKASKPKPRYCDMRIQIKITSPLDPYLYTSGTVTVSGKDFSTTKSFPVKVGTQVITIHDLEPGRYDVQVSYGNYIATKCVILGCICPDNWKEVFAAQAMEQLKSTLSLKCKGCSKYSSGWDYWRYGSGAPYGYRSTGYSYWGASRYYPRGGNLWTTSQIPELLGTGEQKPPCSTVTPCSRNVSFELPKDATD